MFLSPNISSIYKTVVFVDDTILISASFDYCNLCNETNIELEKLSTWTDSNKLFMNVNKIVVLLITNRNHAISNDKI